MSEKVFVGSGKIIKTQYGDLPKITLHKDNVNEIVKWMKSNNSDFVNIAMKQKRDVVEGKPTHYLEVDEWKPDKKEETGLPESESKEEQDLPF